MLDALEGAVAASRRLAGVSFSAADVHVGAHIGWGMAMGSLERRSAFERCWERVGHRPAAVRARDRRRADAGPGRRPTRRAERARRQRRP